MRITKFSILLVLWTRQIYSDSNKEDSSDKPQKESSGGPEEETSDEESGFNRAYNDILQDCPTTVNEFMKYSYQVPVGVENRASKTVPPQFYLDLSSVPGSGIGVFSKTFIPQYTWLGELEGIVKPYSEEETEEDHYEWVIYGGEDGTIEVAIHSAFDEETSNWLRYLQPASNVTKLNVWPLFCYHSVYYVTTRHILPTQELLTYYGEESSEELGIDYTQFPEFN